MRQVVIVDFGMSNLHSVFRKMTRIGGAPVVSSEPAEVAEAEMLVVPGVGHFAKAMDNLASRGLIEPLNEAVVTRKVPVLGICLGMQLFAKRSEEGDVDGLGWLDGRVVRFQVEDPLRFKVPHMGWNGIEQKKPSPLMSNLPPDPSFYFVHSYHFVPGDDRTRSARRSTPIASSPRSSGATSWACSSIPRRATTAASSCSGTSCRTSDVPAEGSYRSCCCARAGS